MGTRNDRNQKKTDKAPLPDEFLWSSSWIRTDRFRNRPWAFTARIVIGGLLGLLLGRVIGSLQGLFGQWLFQGIDVWLGGGLESSLGRVFYWLTSILGTVFGPIVSGSPLADSLSEATTTRSGSLSIVFLAQLHGTLNGLYQGLKPAAGHNLSAIIERIILPWGHIWQGITYPLRWIFWKPARLEALRPLLANPTDSQSLRKLRRLAGADQLPRMHSADMQTEWQTVKSFPGGPALDQRRRLWWSRPSFRADVYRWIEQKKIITAFPIILRGLHDPDQGARRRAVHAMASLGEPGIIAPLLHLVEDEDEETRKTAVAGIQTLSRTT